MATDWKRMEQRHPVFLAYLTIQKLIRVRGKNPIQKIGIQILDALKF